jgi:ABC-type amino acid transport substrate-binding protein
MRKRRKSLFTLLFAAILAISIITTQNHPIFASLVGKDTLTMITSPDYPPFEYYENQGSTRKIVGFDIDIANYIAKELGFKLEIMETDFGGLIPALQANRADFAMASMNPTPERKQNVDFSLIYYQGRDTIVADKGSKITKLEDLAGKRLGVQLGTTQEQSAKKNGSKVTRNGN